MRLDSIHTLDQMKYQKRLDDNLSDPATKGKLEELQIYVRPPKDMTGPTQTFQLTVVEPGKFDVESSFIEPEKQSLHVLARVKRPKTPAKKGAQSGRDRPARRVQHRHRGPASRTSTGPSSTSSKFKDDTKGNNTFKSKLLDLNAKNVQIYLYGSKDEPVRGGLDLRVPQGRAQRRQSQDRALPGVVRRRRQGQESLRRWRDRGQSRGPEKKRSRPSRSDVPGSR